MELREQKGRVIAEAFRIVRKDGKYLVPSQSGKGRYTVNLFGGAPSCSCQDYETNGKKCKHIYAAEISRELPYDPAQYGPHEQTPPVKRPTYAQNWPAYNRAQVTEKATFQSLLYDLCSKIPQPPQQYGRRRVLLSDSIFSAAFKIYSTVSGRRFMTDLNTAHQCGYVSRVLCYNSIFKCLEDEDTTPILKALILQASLPLAAVETDFAVDSSGFTTSRFTKWFDVKYGVERQQHHWVKVHMMCGVKTNIITAVEILGRDAQDCPMLPDLLKTTAQTFSREVSGDKAYASFQNYDAIEAAGATPFIPFKSHQGMGNKRPSQRHALWSQMYHYFMFRREEFCEHYHKRSNAESTFSMIKAKFRDHVRSKTDTAMKNEVLCKILCHNICCVISAMHELGIEPDFT